MAYCLVTVRNDDVLAVPAPGEESRGVDNLPMKHDAQAIKRLQTQAPKAREATRAAPEMDVISSAGGRLGALLETASQEVLAVTYWFEPAPHPEPYPVTIRFVGRRVDVEGPPDAGDRFVRDETIEAVVPGSGPVAVTTRIFGVTPGQWRVTAQPQGSAQHLHGRRARAATVASSDPADGASPLLPRLWRRWAPATGPSLEAAEPVETRLLPFIRTPGTLPMAWATLVGLGMALALVTQGLLLAQSQHATRQALSASLVALLVGAIGAKTWYSIKHRRARRMDGWCIQGFILGASLATLLLLALLRQPIGIVLDATAPGLLFGLAVGRLGCFLAGCCGGPPTASRWGVWSSDQRIGARRVPTQLMESALALSVGILALAVVLLHGPSNGTVFVGALAAYTLGRQGIMRLRAEPSQSRLGIPLTATATTLTLVAAIIAHVR